jgi:pseudaminic acid biosynthesis-associated methylase
MKINGTTPQEELWRGKFGNDYAIRNDDDYLPAYNLLWARLMLALGRVPQSILEVGANTGLNIKSLHYLLDGRPKLYAVEPNDRARTDLELTGLCEKVIGGTAQNVGFDDGIAELAFTSGVLIHIPPHELLDACKEIHRCSSRYIACIEYFNDTPVTIPYRYNEDALFKRDFGGFWTDNFDLNCLSYGFIWKKETGLDNLNWWLFEKKER